MYNYLNKHFKYVVLNNYNIVETYDSKNVKEENPKYYFEVITPLEKEISIKKLVTRTNFFIDNCCIS